MFLGWILDAKMGGVGKPKQAFRIILVANYEVPLDHRFSIKNEAKRSSKMIQNRSRGLPRVDF